MDSTTRALVIALGVLLVVALGFSALMGGVMGPGIAGQGPVGPAMMPWHGWMGGLGMGLDGCLSEFRMAARSGNPLAFGGLSRQQKGLDQLTLAAHGRAGKAPVPFSLGHIRLGVEPCREQLKLCRRDLPALNAFEQMLKQRGRKILSADFRHGRQMP